MRISIRNSKKAGLPAFLIDIFQTCDIMYIGILGGVWYAEDI